MARRLCEAVRSLTREESLIHPSAEVLIRCRDGELAEAQKKATEAHLEVCSDCRLEYHRLCQEPAKAAGSAPSPDASMFAGLLENIGNWEQSRTSPERNGEAVKQRIASDVGPLLGDGATSRILESAGVDSENLLASMESVLRAFLGKRIAAQLVSSTVDRAIFLKGSPRKDGHNWSWGSFRDLERSLPKNLSRVILLTAVCTLGLGLAAFAAWWHTGNSNWITAFFRLPGAACSIGIAGVELWLSVRVIGRFAPGEALRTVWSLVAASAACNLASAVIAEVLDATAGGSTQGEDALLQWRNIGLTLGGTYRFALLAAALYCGLKVYRHSGFLARLRAVDWVFLGIPAAFVVLKLTDLLVGPSAAHLPDVWTLQGWLVDPILWLMLGHSLLLFRSMRKMGLGGISRCWGCYCVGVFLTSVGDLAAWAAQHRYIPGPLISLAWCAWLPAAVALALAPAYQLEAIRMAEGGDDGK